MPVLRQAGVLAQLGARRQVLPRGLEIVALAEHHAQPHVHVRRAPQHGGAVRRRGGQSVLVDGYRVAESAARDGNVGQGDGDAERV